MIKRLLITCVTFLLITELSQAAIYNEQSFRTRDDFERYKELTNELRCLVCQNQTIADSASELASDLRDIVFERIDAGGSNDEIRQFMVERYGNFVLYKPPLQISTIVLWFSPILLIIIGFIGIGIYIRRQYIAKNSS